MPDSLSISYELARTLFDAKSIHAKVDGETGLLSGILSAPDEDGVLLRMTLRRPKSDTGITSMTQHEFDVTQEMFDRFRSQGGEFYADLSGLKLDPRRSGR